MSNPNQPADVQPPADLVTAEQLSEAEAEVAERLQEELKERAVERKEDLENRRRSARLDAIKATGLGPDPIHILGKNRC